MEDNWISVGDALPLIGQPVLLFANGVIQNAIFYLDGDGPTNYFWSSLLDIDELPEVGFALYWMPLPQPPEK